MRGAPVFSADANGVIEADQVNNCSIDISFHCGRIRRRHVGGVAGLRSHSPEAMPSRDGHLFYLEV